MKSNIATKAASIAFLVYFEHNYFRKWRIKNSHKKKWPESLGKYFF
jgi:hypothetical protein